jgi:hypothetical protein
LSADVLMKIYGYKILSEAQAHLDRINQAMKEQKLFEVKVE